MVERQVRSKYFITPYGLLLSAGARFLSDAWLDGLLLVMILGVLQAPLLKLKSRSVVDKLCLPVLFASKPRNQRALFVLNHLCLVKLSACSVWIKARHPSRPVPPCHGWKLFSQFLLAFCPAYAILPPIKLNTANHEHLDQRVSHHCAAGSLAKSHGLKFFKKVH